LSELRAAHRNRDPGQDYWLLQGLFLFFTLAVIAFNLIAEFTDAYLDPRVREV
jgi:ABC-type dipeptide/oligopeptide/nickel transport system permease component